MTTYKVVTKDNKRWLRFENGVLSDVTTSLALGYIFNGLAVGQQMNTGDVIVKVGGAFTKRKFLDVVSPPPVTPPPSGESKLYKMLRVQQIGKPNPLAEANSKGVGTPDIIELDEGNGRVQFTRAWQIYLLKINPNMQPKHVAAIMGSGRWGFNRTGLPSERFPQKRANWIMNEDTEYSNPETDKVRTFTYCVHRGIRDGSDVVLETMNGNEPPPVGVTPATHPYFFCHLTIVYPNERSITPFPNGAPAWGYTGNFTFFPLVSTSLIRVPLSQVREVSSYQLPYIPTRL